MENLSEWPGAMGAAIHSLSSGGGGGDGDVKGDEAEGCQGGADATEIWAPPPPPPPGGGGAQLSVA